MAGLSGSSYQLQAFRGDTEIYSRPYPAYGSPVLRYEPTTAKVYEATRYGLGILDPRTGTREAAIQFPFDDDHPSLPGEVHPPSVEARVLYAISGLGRVFALRHP